MIIPGYTVCCKSKQSTVIYTGSRIKLYTTNIR